MYSTDAPTCHACGGVPAFQWTRRASREEADIQRAQIADVQGRALSDEEAEQRYGPLRTSVTGCAVHHLGDDPEDADSGLDRRALLHDADCKGHGLCACTSTS